MKIVIDQKQEVARRSVENIRNIAETMGERNTGSEGEKRTADFYTSRLENACDFVKTESFDVYPDAYTGWTYIVGTLSILALVSYFFSAMVSVLLVAIALTVYIVQFVLGKRFLDPLYKKEKSQNVTAIKKSLNAPKCRVFFVSSVDATKEWTLIRRLGGTMLTVVLCAVFVGLVYLLAIDVARWIIVGGLGAEIASGDMLVAGYVAIVFAPCWLSLFFFVNHRKVIEGANENLSGCETAVAIVEEMSAKNVTANDVEVGVILTGGEQSGLRGAKSWCDIHAKDFADVPTYFVHLGVLKEPKCICINDKERCGLIKADESLVNMLVDCANSANVKCKKSTLGLFGTTDASVFSKYGLKSASVTGFDGRKCPEYLHTRYDTADNTSEFCIANTFEICCALVEKLDGEQN